jgi:hypothetical protein
VFVVDDFFAHVYGRPVQVESDFNHVDGPHHARTKAAGLEQKDLSIHAICLPDERL